LYLQIKIFYTTDLDFALLKRKTNSLMQHPRNVVGCAALFLCGHAHMKRHNEVLLQGTNQVSGDWIKCILCILQVIEDPEHVILACEAIHMDRNRIMGTCIIRDLSPTWDMTEFVNMTNLTKVIM
jgi:hypothetical protein